MTEIQITVDKAEYLPGDSVEGQVHIITEGLESYEGLRLDFNGIMLTRVVRGSGKNRRVYEDEIPIIQVSQTLEENPEFNPGKTSVDFTLQIPKGAPGTYYGHNGWIQYTVKAVLEKKNWIDQDTETNIEVAWLAHNDPVESGSIHWTEEKDDHIPLEVDIPSDVLTLGKDFSFKLKVSEKQKLREVRAIIAFKEQVAPDGIHEAHLAKMEVWRIPESELMRESWTDVIIPTSIDWPFPFMSELIWTHYVLRVEIDVPWRFDVVAEFPLQLIYPFKTEEPDSDMEPIFDWEK